MQQTVISSEYYPRWLKSENYRTYQTSGITFISEDENGTEEFLLIDDIGKLHRLQISQDSIFRFAPIYFSTEVVNYLNAKTGKTLKVIYYNNSTKVEFC